MVIFGEKTLIISSFALLESFCKYDNFGREKLKNSLRKQVGCNPGHLATRNCTHPPEVPFDGGRAALPRENYFDLLGRWKNKSRAR